MKVQTILHVSLSLAVFAILSITRHDSHQAYDTHLTSLDSQVKGLAVFRDSVRIREQIRYKEVERLARRIEENEKVIVKLDRDYADLTKRVQRYQVSEQKALAVIDQSDNAGLVNIFRGIPSE